MSAAYDPLFEALSDNVRRDIIKLLKEQEQCASEIHSNFYASRTAISYHLGLLLKAGIVKVRKEGRNLYYSLDPSKLAEYLAQFSEEFTPAR